MTNFRSKFRPKQKMSIFGPPQPSITRPTSNRFCSVLIYSTAIGQTKGGKNQGVLASLRKMWRSSKVGICEKSNFGPLLLVADWSDRNTKKRVTRVCSGLQHTKAHPNRFSIKWRRAHQNIAPVEIRDFGAKNGSAKNFANGRTTKNTEQMEAFWVNQTRRFHFW